MFRDRCNGAVCTAKTCIFIGARRCTSRLELEHPPRFYEALSPAEVLNLQIRSLMLQLPRRFGLAVRLSIAKFILPPLF